MCEGLDIAGTEYLVLSMGRACKLVRGRLLDISHYDGLFVVHTLTHGPQAGGTAVLCCVAKDVTFEVNDIKCYSYDVWAKPRVRSVRAYRVICRISGSCGA